MSQCGAVHTSIRDARRLSIGSSRALSFFGLLRMNLRIAKLSSNLTNGYKTPPFRKTRGNKQEIMATSWISESIGLEVRCRDTTSALRAAVRTRLDIIRERKSMSLRNWAWDLSP